MQSTVSAPRYDTRGVEIRSQRDTVVASLLRCPEGSGRAKDARAAQRRVLSPGRRGRRDAATPMPTVLVEEVR